MQSKLVRDKIPEIIEAMNHVAPETRTLSPAEFKTALAEKLVEEVAEVQEAINNNSNIKEEVADVLELIHAIAKDNGTSYEEIEKIRKNKLAERGGFSKRILLIKK